MSKWQFNQQLLQETVNSGNRFLLNPNLSRKERIEITSDIKRFQLFLDGNFENMHRKRYLNFPNIKKSVLSNMKRYRKVFTKDFRSWIIELAQSRIFSYDKEIPIFTLDIDETSQEVLANYRDNAPLLYRYANEILNNSETSLVQEAVLESSSYCFYSDILRLPFIIIDPLDEAYALNHEVQHGIEFLMGSTNHHLYNEFGPIHFESLFNDRMYEQYGRESLSGYLNRIKDTEEFLKVITIYFYAMSVFERYNFDVDDNLFIEVFSESTNLYGDNLLDFLNDEMVNIEITETLGYLLSFLKAIEVRDYRVKGCNEGNAMFNNILFNKKFKFNIPETKFEPYVRFIEEIKEKVK